MAKTKLILSTTEAANYAKYLMGFSDRMTGSNTVYLGLGNISGANFTEITPNDKNNYARIMVKSSAAYPDVLTADGRTVKNHEQIVGNKVLSEAYTANAIAFYRQETGGSPYAYGLLGTPLNATVGSLPMFEREQLQLTIPDGTEAD